jgi:hypothetical protein
MLLYASFTNQQPKKAKGKGMSKSLKTTEALKTPKGKAASISKEA